MDDEQRQAILDNIPEFSTIEGQKENVMPRREGRSATSLVTLYNSSSEEREQQLQQGHDQFSLELQDSNDLDDPLDVYLRYIRWTIEMYPEGHSQYSDLKGLLQETTSKFQQSKRYQNDIRYLKVWIKYIDYLDNPEEAYQLLMRNHIGDACTLFYEEYANYLEGRKRYEDAKIIYDKGCELNAEPKDRLERKRKQFMIRMEQQRQEQEEHQRNAFLSNNRVPLGMKYDHSLISPSREQQLQRSTSASSLSSSSRRAQFSVYTGPEIDNTPLPTSTSSSAALVDNSRQRPENQSEVSTFSGTTIPQKPYRRPKQRSSFTVYRDDEQAQGEEEESITQQSNNNSIYSNNSNNNTRSITKNTKSLSSTSLSKMIEKFNTNRHLYIKTYDSKGNTEIIAATKDCLKKSNNPKQEPISFEELRYQALEKQIQLEKLRTSSTITTSSSFFSNSLYNDPEPSQLTQETKNATDLVNDLIYGQGEEKDQNNKQQEEEEPLSFTPQNIQRYHTDENAIDSGPLSKMNVSREESSNSLFEEPFINNHNSDNEDLDYVMRQEAEKAKRIPLKRTRPY
ncbi:Mad3/BUB1 homology region 1-domain-containing protein [Circinella umbellata]|nr:Mad3/BUB1 homology region 1-domain-containing protein [Circinella umbellata]